MTITKIPIITGNADPKDNNDTPAQKNGDGLPNLSFVHDVINKNADELTELKTAYTDNYVLHCQLYDPSQAYQDDRWIITPQDYINSIFDPNVDLIAINGWSTDGNTVITGSTPTAIDNFGTLAVNGDGTILFLDVGGNTPTGAFTIYIHYTVSGQPRKVPAVITVNTP